MEVIYLAGEVVLVEEETMGKGSISVLAIENRGGARSLGRESFLFKKENDENLSEERLLLL
jgi:hypothetical protein